MNIKRLIKGSLQLRKLLFLLIGFLFCMGFQPLYAQEIRDTITQKDTVFQIVDIFPEFPGGTKALYEFLRENIVSPLTPKSYSIDETVIVKFVIEKDGSVTNVNLLKSCGHPILDEEALRVTKLMPNWKPAKTNGKPVRVHFQMPFKFQLNDDNEDNKSEKEPLKGNKKKK